MNSQGALPMSWPVVDAAEALTIVARGQGIGGTQGGAEGGGTRNGTCNGSGEGWACQRVKAHRGDTCDSTSGATHDGIGEGQTGRRVGACTNDARDSAYGGTNCYNNVLMRGSLDGGDGRGQGGQCNENGVDGTEQAGPRGAGHGSGITDIQCRGLHRDEVDGARMDRARVDLGFAGCEGARLDM
jgi:hypothetical protein